MERKFAAAIANRRSYYALDNRIQVSEQEIKKMIETALLNVPSAFNSQTTRIVLLLGENHKKLWEITKSILKSMLPQEVFAQTEKKIDTSFESGYGTVLFYEDTLTVKKLQEQFPLYANRFTVWSEHTSAMHQFTIWTLLEDAGMGASLQHYNPLIDSKVSKQWNISSDWKLIAQMPFGNPIAQPGEKTHEPLEKRFLVY